MKCARCSAEIPRQSQFCLRCGTPINAAANYAPPTPSGTRPLAAIPTPNNRPLIAIITLLALAVLAMGAWMVKSSLAQKPGISNNTSLVQAPAISGPGPLIQAPGENKPTPIVVAPPIVPSVQPNYSDIDDYLRFVAQVERTKLNLEKQELADALITMTKVTSEQPSIAEGENDGKTYLPNINAHNKDYSSEWNKLTQMFVDHKPQPPQSCVGLHDKYYVHLGKTTSLFNKLHDALAQASSGQSSEGIAALTSMQGNRDAEDSAQVADDELKNICRTYNLEQTFHIQAESGGGGALLH